MLGNQLKLEGFIKTSFWISNSDVFVMWKNETLNIWNFMEKTKDMQYHCEEIDKFTF